uniref:N(6)-L-threonylcarbamoyladenine synthase n=1 Tax=Panagrolaimus sp. PS1159 TaxID=55785 RepID=A0AC35GH76_9BILA
MKLPPLNKFIFKRFLNIHSVKRPIVLGIETSCDDSAVAIVSADKKVLNSKVFVNRIDQQRIGGISPALSAMQHRTFIDKLIEECLDEIPCRLGDLDAIAVTSCPGLVICLKVGLERAISLARISKVQLMQVHHMRAHALSSRLIDASVDYPFLSLLISGGHFKSPSDFDIIGMDSNTSPGECLDKIAREIGLKSNDRHFGAEVERLARQSNEDGCLRFSIKSPSTIGADFYFGSIKNSFLNLIVREKLYSLAERDTVDLCASLQFQVTAHLCRKLHLAFEFLQSKDIFQDKQKTLVLSGGVAANQFIFKAIEKLTNYYGYKLIVPPGRLCTDNAEMIAWTGIEMMNENPNVAIPWTSLPSKIYAYDRYPIGTSNLRNEIQTSKFKPQRKLSLQSILKDQIYFTGKPINI